jgi:hypothetical protein
VLGALRNGLWCGFAGEALGCLAEKQKMYWSIDLKFCFIGIPTDYWRLGLFGFVAYLGEEIHNPRSFIKLGAMHNPRRNQVFVACYAPTRFTVKKQIHFALDYNSPLGISVVVRGQIHPLLEFEENELCISRLHYPCSGAFEGNLGFG